MMKQPRFYVYHEEKSHTVWVVERKVKPPCPHDDKLVAQFDDRYPVNRAAAERLCAELNEQPDPDPARDSNS